MINSYVLYALYVLLAYKLLTYKIIKTQMSYYKILLGFSDYISTYQSLIYWSSLIVSILLVIQ